MNATPPLTLVSHVLCPYVQRAAIVLAEKNAPFERRYVDLSDKPAWFRAVSPLGKMPVLLVGDAPIFESAVIGEYLDDTLAPRLHPADPLQRARHRPRPRPRVRAWRAQLAQRPSVRGAVLPEYPERLRAFLRQRQSALSKVMVEVMAHH